jgi:hypothetical protein
VRLVADACGQRVEHAPAGCAVRLVEVEPVDAHPVAAAAGEQRGPDQQRGDARHPRG